MGNIDRKTSLDKLYNFLKPMLDSIYFSKNNESFLKKQFQINKKQFDATTSNTPLEDLLVEKAAILFR